MINRPTGDAIPTGGLKNKALLYLEHVSGDRRISKFIWQRLVFVFFKQFPTILGTYLRPLVYKTLLGYAGQGCLIERNVRFDNPSRIFLSDRVFVGENCWISAGPRNGEIRVGNDVFIANFCSLRAHGGKISIAEHAHLSRNSYIHGIGGVEIGKDSMFGPNVVIMSGNHGFTDLEVPMRLQNPKKEKIEIENDVWLGANVCVMPGVTIETGAIIGSGAVVTGNIPAYSIAAGVPAKVIRKR